MSEYSKFVNQKLTRQPPTGLADVGDMPPWLFPFQQDLVRWGLKRGRAAIFADTGLGKTRMEIAWANEIVRSQRKPILMLAPLAVAAQTAREGALVGVGVTVCRDDGDVAAGVNVTNYERLHKFDPSRFGGVVLDESSCIKHHDSKTLGQLIDAFAATPFRLCATATPAPNDWTELGTHAEFLGICTRAEMLAEFFVHDGGETSVWRLKGHARGAFWRWVSGWGAMVRRPSDLGYRDDGYVLQPLRAHQHTLPANAADVKKTGLLFATEAQSLMERRSARRGSIDSRVEACADLVNSDDRPWVVWCDLNAESRALTDAIRGAVEVTGSDDLADKERALTDAIRGAVEVTGSDDLADKERALIDFADGKIRVVVTKPSIAGFGLNWQHCARMAFVGVTDSWEAYYQAVRRCWRFGQREPVDVHVFASELEGAVISNLQRKERDAADMANALSAETRTAVRLEVLGQARQTNDYKPTVKMQIPQWLTTDMTEVA